MAASVGVSPEWSLAGTAPFRAELVIGTRGAAATAPVPSPVSCPHTFELRCAELHPVRCDGSTARGRPRELDDHRV